MIPETYSHPAEQSFALNQLDLKLKPYLNFNGGFFIEAGAHDGINQSTTLYFERYRNWKGILIEPVPELAAKCKENRPDCIVENCALVPFDYQKQTIEMYYCSLMSLVKGAQKTAEDDLKHVQAGCQVQGIESYLLTVKARTLTLILDQYSVKEIDLFSLDVEGYELDVLRGLDFEKYRPNYLLIEARFREEIDRFLAPYYQSVAELFHHDVLFKSKQRIQEESQISITTPVALLMFNRPALTQRVFARIAQVKPSTLLVIADGPRTQEDVRLCAETRGILDRIDWDCRVLKEFAEENLGCKRRVSSGLAWVFSEVEEAIILEDDCLPALSFFTFCRELLERYRYDQRVFVISGDNFQFGQPRTNYSYYFSRYPHCWGWASWRRAWRYFDVTMSSWPEFKAGGNMKSVFENPAEERYRSNILDECYKDKINSWAHIWAYTCWSQSALTILPEVNLVSNIGFGVDATHTRDLSSPLADLPTGEVWKIKHPKEVVRNVEADAFTFENVFSPQLQGHANQISQSQAALSEKARDCERLNQELQGRAAQIAQLRADRSKLEAELSERINESDQLRRQIDSLHGSICWRLTWPIRWLHRQANRARSGLWKALSPLKTFFRISVIGDLTKKLNKELQVYLQEAKNYADAPSAFNIWQLIRDFPVWCLSLRSGANPISDQRPWITYGAIRFLESVAKKNMRVYEYGAGGSTLFFLKRCKEIFTCEHDPLWAEKVQESLHQMNSNNYYLKVVEPVLDQNSFHKDPSDPDAYVSHSPRYNGFDFKAYAETIDQFPDRYFHIILIDGRARPSCAKHAIPKLAGNRYIILDNAERKAYSAVHELMARHGFLKRPFYGPGSHNRYFWLTCIWQKVQ